MNKPLIERRCITCNKILQTKQGLRNHLKEFPMHTLEPVKEANDRLFLRLATDFTHSIENKDKRLKNCHREKRKAAKIEDLLNKPNQSPIQRQKSDEFKICSQRSPKLTSPHHGHSRSSSSNSIKKVQFVSQHTVPKGIYKDISKFDREFQFITEDTDSYKNRFGHDEDDEDNGLDSRPSTSASISSLVHSDPEDFGNYSFDTKSKYDSVPPTQSSFNSSSSTSSSPTYFDSSNSDSKIRLPSINAIWDPRFNSYGFSNNRKP